MKLVKPSVELLEQKPKLQGVFDAISMAASTCYQSLPKDSKSAQRFVDTLIMNGHTAMLEFGAIYLVFPITSYMYEYGAKKDYHGAKKYINDPYSKTFVIEQDDKVYVTTNYRVIIENHWESDLRYMSEPTEYHYKRHTARFVISIGTGREFTRHRHFSFAQESTRYCNYSKDKFNNEVTFIIPSWAESIGEGQYNYPLRPDEVSDKEFIFSYACYETEKFYLDLLNNASCTPQQAREVLPLATKTVLCMSGFESDWRAFFDLRLRGTTGAPHPDAKYCAEMLHNKFKEIGIDL